MGPWGHKELDTTERLCTRVLAARVRKSEPQVMFPAVLFLKSMVLTRGSSPEASWRIPSVVKAPEVFCYKVAS